MTFSKTMLCHNAQYLDDECRTSITVMLNVLMLNIVMLSNFMLNVLMLTVVLSRNIKAITDTIV